jgi:hypothetical protein
MSPEFRFMVICRSASLREDGTVNLLDVVNEIDGSRTERTELAVAIGLLLLPTMNGKSLDLMAYKLGKKLEHQKLPGFVGQHLELPDGKGPQVLPYSVAIPTPETGVYGFDLWDRDGAFGPPETLLAHYLFGVHVN